MNDHHSENRIELSVVVAYAWRRWYVVVRWMVLFLLLGSLLIALRTPVYRAEAGIVMTGARQRVMFEDRIRVDQAAETDVQKYGWFAERKRTIRRLIVSPAVVSEVLHRAQRKGVPGADKLSVERALAPGSRLLSVQQEGDIFQVHCRHHQPRLAHYVVSGVAETAVRYINGLYDDAVSVDVLNRERAIAFEAFKESAERYEQHVASSGREALAAELQALRDTLTFKYTMLEDLARKRILAQGLHEQFSAPGVSTAVALYDSLALMRFRAGLFASGALPADLELKLDAGGGALPVVHRDEAIATVEATARAIERQQAALRDLLRAGNERAKIGELIARIERIDRKTRELADARDVRWNSYAALERKWEEQNLLLKMRGNSLVKVAYIREQPSKPERRGRLFILLGSALLGFVVGLGHLFGFSRGKYLESSAP